MHSGSYVSLCMYCVQQLLFALLTASAIDSATLVHVSVTLISAHSFWSLVLFAAVSFWLYGAASTALFLCIAIFGRRADYFLTSFEALIVIVSMILSLQNMTSLSVYGNAIQEYSTTASMNFISIAYVCIGAGCFATWFTFEVVKFFWTQFGYADVLVGRFWQLKTAFLIATVAISVYLVDAVSMINWMVCLVVFSEKGLVVKMCGVWSLLILITLYVSNYLSTLRNVKKTIVRKLFHVLAFMLFTPALLFELHSFLCLSIGLVLCLFILLEFLRVYVFADFAFSQPSLSYMSRSANYFTWFAHKKELQRRNNIVLSHITLLSGCGYSIYLYTALLHHLPVDGATTVRGLALRLLPHLGIVSVCIADSLASVCGSVWGKRKWHAGGSRTTLGSAAAFIGMLVTSLALLLIEYSFHSRSVLSIDEGVRFTVILVCVSAITTLAEAFTNENDNLVLPFCSSCSYLLLLYLFL